MEDIIDIIVTETTNLITITSSGSDEVIDVNIIDNREDIVLNVTPSVVEININSLTGNFGVLWGQITGTLSNQTDLNTALGLKADLVGGKVPSSQLPSYVDDVVEVANYAALPATGETGKIYITLDTNFMYRWSGSTYIEIKDSSAVWGAITGTLSSQTDLQNALNAKFDDPTGDTTQYIDGTGALQTFPVLASADKLILVVRNTSGATITKGTVVYINGANGNKPTIAKALATGDATSAQTLGLVQTNIANNSNGNVVLVGSVIDLDTSSFTEGQQLYLSGVTAGAYTATKTLAPTHLVYVGVIARAHPTQGVIEVKIQNGYELDEIHDVSITSVANNDGLFYEASTDLWKNKSIATVLGYTPANDSSVVKLTGNQTIAGTKTFSSGIISTATDGNYFLRTEDIDFLNHSVSNSIRLHGITNADQAFLYFGSNASNNIFGFDNSKFVLTGVLNVSGNLTASSFIKSGGTSAQFLKADGSVDSSTYLTTSVASSTYLPLAGGAMSGQIVLKESSSSTDYTKGLRFPNDPFTGSGDISGLRLYSSSGENQVLELYIGNDGGLGFDNINFATGVGGTANNDSVTINGNKIWNSGNLTPQTQLNGTGFVKASGTTITYDNTSYLPLGGGILTGALNGTSGTFSSLFTGNYGGLFVIPTESPASGNVALIARTSNGGNDIFRWFDGATQLGVFKNSGSVGIGTASPSDFIDATSGLAVMASSGRAGITIGSTTTTADEVLGRLSFTNTNSTNVGSKRLAAISGLRGTTDNSAYLEFVVANNGLGSQVMTLNQSGYLTVGGLRLKGSDTANTIYNANSNMAITCESGYNISIGRSSDTTKSLNVNTTNGNVVIGGVTTQNSATNRGNLTVNGTSSVLNLSISDLNAGYLFHGGTDMLLVNAKNGALSIYTNDNPRMTILSGGDVLINDTANTLGGKLATKLNDNGYALSALKQGTFGAGILVRVDNTSSDYIRFFYSSSNTQTGSINTNGTTTSYNVTSDYRLKQDLKPIKGLELVNKIKVYDYEWKSDNSRMDGVLAHELAEVLPYAVTGVKDGEQMQQVDYSKIVPVMVQAIKELKAELDTLKNK